MKIISLNVVPQRIEDILQLHRENSKTLGFLPEPVFHQAVLEDRVLVAIDSDDIIVGYLLFGINRGGNFIYITHLCISKLNRKQGIARELFKKVIENYSSVYRGVRVSCRKDFAATEVWEKLGFTFVYEKPGRSKDGTTLYIWWYDFNHHDLFTIDTSTKLNVVIDSNIAYDLMEAETERTIYSHALMADWLIEDVEYYITPQLKNDISHHEDKCVRDKSSQFVSQFKISKDNHRQFHDVFDEIKRIYNKPSLSTREESDIRHMTWSVISDASYFLTKDEGIIKYSNIILDKYSLVVLKPEEFIIKFSALLNETDYNPSRLAGTNITKKRANIEDLREVPRLFFQSDNERLKQLDSKIKNALIQNNTNAYLVESKRNKLAFYTIRELENILEIEFFRYPSISKNRTVVTQLVHDIIYLAREKNKSLICVSELHIQEEFEKALVQLSFIKVAKKYYRFISNDLIKFNELKECLQKKIEIEEVANAYINILKPFIYERKNSFEVEKFLFPLKILDLNLPCFIIPIKPKWAMNLFNVSISEQDLFGGESKLLFNTENVYYRAANPIVLSTQSRILWYISKDNNRFTDTMNVSTSSYIKHIEIDKPKVLFSKNKRFGIYNWNDVLKTAKNDINKKIMAFSFELNENFIKPVSISDLNNLYNKHLGRDFFFPQTPYKISEDLFFDIYSHGMRELIYAK